MRQHRRVGSHSLFSLIEELIVSLAEVGVEHSVLVRNGRVVYPQRCAGGEQRTGKHLLVAIEIGSGCTVVAAHETLHERVGIELRVPHQLAEHVGTKFCEVGAERSVHLLEEHRGVVALEELYVLLENVEVGERSHHVVEVDAVVPDEDVVGNLRPAFERTHEVASRLVVGERHLALGVDVAEHYVHVWQRLHMLRRVHGEEVGKRRELLVGEAFCQAVEEAYVAAGRRTLVLVHLAALGALAVGVVAVVLTYRNHVLLGVGLEYRVDAVGYDLEDVGIGEAPLAVVAGTSFAVDERVVLGVRLAVDRRRQKSVERMHPHVGGEHLAVLLQAHPVAVGAVVVRVAERLSEAERRTLRHVHLRNAHVGRRRERVEILSEIFDAELFLEQCRNAVYSTLAARRLYGECAARTVDYVSVVGGFVGRLSNHNAVLRAVTIGNDSQVATRCFAHEALQQLRRLTVHVVLLSKHDACLRLALAHERHLR